MANEKKEISEYGQKICSRIKEVRNTLNLSLAKFADGAGLTKSIVCNIEYALIEPNRRYIDDICKAYGVNLTWVETGEGEMFRKMSREEEIADFVGRTLADDSDGFAAQLIGVLSQLDTDGWEALEKVSEALLEAEKKYKEKGED